jgi:hypothetical protein
MKSDFAKGKSEIVEKTTSSLQISTFGINS